MEWNEEQDGGRSIQEANKILIQQYPEHKENILAYYDRWEEMLTGAIQGTVDILEKFIKDENYKVVGLTNWSAETFPVAQERYEFLSWFEGIVVSGKEHCKKPEEKIYNILLDRYNLIPQESLFIDDNKRNVLAAEKMGINCIHFQSPEQLESELQRFDINL